MSSDDHCAEWNGEQSDHFEEDLSPKAFDDFGKVSRYLEINVTSWWPLGATLTSQFSRRPSSLLPSVAPTKAPASSTPPPEESFMRGNYRAPPARQTSSDPRSLGYATRRFTCLSLPVPLTPRSCHCSKLFVPSRLYQTSASTSCVRPVFTSTRALP